ncbi:RNA helicase [Teratosphaeriaceae sp. CCFEE 6253]|nr:RNA helicase [Teratosphaeriaceae sp. CCFEE 6253]
MFRLPTTLCPFCDALAASRTHPRPPWHSPRSRTAATLQKRRPSRMNLSPHVARGPRPADSADTPKRKSRNSPFGGMNVTEPPRAGHGVERGISASEQKRATRFAKPEKGGEKGKEKDPMKALKMQRALATVSYESRSRVKAGLNEVETFEQFDLLPIIQSSVSSQALGGMVGVSPTPIQRLAIPALLGTEDGKHRRRRRPATVDASGQKAAQHFLLAAETGSGKTLAYVLPALDALKRAERAEAEEQRVAAAQPSTRSQAHELPTPDQPHPSTARPRLLILLPTSELVAQVGALLKSLSHTIKFKSALLSTAYTATVIKSRLFSPTGIDVVVSTPHLIESITMSDPNVLSRVTHLVVDEADSLLDRSFAPITSGILDKVSPSLQQLILCSATIPRSIDAYLAKRFPDLRRLTTPNLHAVPRRVQLSVVDIEKLPFQGNRDVACAQTIWDIGREGAEEEGEGEEAGAAKAEKKVVVFVNEREKAAELAAYLRGKGVDATALSRDSDERRQADLLAAFTGATVPSTNPSKPAKTSPPTDQQQQQQQQAPSPASSGLARLNATLLPPPPRKLSGVKVLVMTDLGSRGIDTVLARHVVLYDVPHTSIDFLHRLGRVGRMGRRGRGVVLVGKGDRGDVVKEVREGMFRGQALI